MSNFRPINRDMDFLMPPQSVSGCRSATMRVSLWKWLRVWICAR
jgi:hypothetical protein